MITLFTYFTLHHFFHIFNSKWNIFLIPDNVVDRLKLGMYFIFLITTVKGLIRTIYYFQTFLVLS